jgi:hypothetical protein
MKLPPARSSEFANNPQTDQTLTTASRQFQSSPVLVGETDFFGFFGALKKGDFFGVHPKKVGGPRSGEGGGWNQALPPAVLSLSPLAPCGRRAGGEGSEAWGAVRTGGARMGGVFWGAPQKSPPHWRGELTGLGRPGSNSFSTPVFQPAGLATLRHKVWPKNFVSQLPGTSDVATN